MLLQQKMLWFLASYCALFSIQFSLQYYLLWMLLSIHHWALFPMPAMCSCALLCCTWWACSCCCCCLVVTYCGAPVSDVCLLESSCNLRCWHHPLLYADVVPFCVCASIVLSASFPCLHWTSLFVAGVLLVSSKMFVHFYGASASFAVQWKVAFCPQLPLTLCCFELLRCYSTFCEEAITCLSV